ncbi:MAG TPA: uracil-DNA glycosylase, partial [Gemmatimonadaceae bacterium]|nr:uracil-DNA glycosylase [Gemmatimonadaceae bacterium]
LEQRRDLGESELVLDGLSVEDVMRIVGALGTSTREAPASRAERPATPPPAAEPAPPSRPPLAEADRGLDWRQALRAADGDAEDEMARKGARKSEPRAEPAPAEAAGALTDAAAHPNAPAGSPMPPEIAGLPSLDAIATMVAACTRCPLHATATHPVPGEGNPDADFVCVGEAPGANEDATGRPFVGQAGQLLTKILAAINLTREEVFICNVLKHRPPANRNPEPHEVAACSPYLRRQLELIRPKVIVAFGTFAAQTLLDTKLPLGKLRGQVHEYHGVPLVVTYHPAALLRNPSWKRPTWEDVKLARRILDSARA